MEKKNKKEKRNKKRKKKGIINANFLIKANLRGENTRLFKILSSEF